MKGRTTPALAATFWLLTAASPAHDTWIRARNEAAGDRTLVFDLSSGMAFPALDTAIAPERVASAGLRLNGREVPLVVRGRGQSSLELLATPPAPGLAIAWVTLHPRALELTSAQVREYLEDITAPASVREAWSARGGRWRERYVKHAKTCLRIGGGAGDGSWAQPVGLALEIVPESDPTALRVGDRLSVRLLKNGAPLAALAIGIEPSRVRALSPRSDAEGRVSFVVEMAGPLLLHATELRPSSRADLEWESDFTTLALEVAPR